jgi:proteasome lid subunit RPN8/RPN11
VPIRYSDTLLAQVCRHAESEYPREACGMIAGPKGGGASNSVYPVRNVQDELHLEDPDTYTRDARTAYHMDARQQLAIERTFGERGLELKAIYHSHPDHGAYFSDEDQLLAAPWGEPNHPGLAWLVVSVLRGRASRVSEFSWDEHGRRYTERVLVDVRTEA